MAANRPIANADHPVVDTSMRAPNPWRRRTERQPSPAKGKRGVQEVHAQAGEPGDKRRHQLMMRRALISRSRSMAATSSGSTAPAPQLRRWHTRASMEVA